MNIENVKRTPSKHSRSVLINIRITPEISKWLKDKDYSPTNMFYEALRELNCPHVENMRPVGRIK